MSFSGDNPNISWYRLAWGHHVCWLHPMHFVTSDVIGGMNAVTVTMPIFILFKRGGPACEYSNPSLVLIFKMADRPCLIIKEA